MLIQEIERKRKQLFEIANCFGINSNETLECSKELDKLIATYQKNQHQHHSYLYENIG